jgi:hypothetical protein
LSSSSSRVASRTTGFARAGRVVDVLMAPPPHPQENDASVAQTIHVNTRIFNPTVLIGTNEAI